MKIDLDGEFEIPTPPEETFRFLTDPGRFAPLLPYFKELKNVDDRGFDVVLEIGVPQIRGIAEVRVTPVELSPPSRARYTSSGRHALGMVDSEMSFAIEPVGSGSKVVWKTSGVVHGTLASMAQGILVPLAKRQIKLLVKSIRDAFDPGAADAAPPRDGLVKRGMTSLHALFQKKEASS